MDHACTGLSKDRASPCHHDLRGRVTAARYRPCEAHLVLSRGWEVGWTVAPVSYHSASHALGGALWTQRGTAPSCTLLRRQVCSRGEVWGLHVWVSPRWSETTGPALPPQLHTQSALRPLKEYLSGCEHAQFCPKEAFLTFTAVFPRPFCPTLLLGHKTKRLSKNGVSTTTSITINHPSIASK